MRVWIRKCKQVDFFSALLERNMKFFSEEGEIKQNVLSMFGPLSIPSSKDVIKEIASLNF